MLDAEQMLAVPLDGRPMYSPMCYCKRWGSIGQPTDPHPEESMGLKQAIG